MTRTTDGPRRTPGTPAPSSARPASRPASPSARTDRSQEDDAELARKEARALLEQTGHGFPSTGQKASRSSGERRHEQEFALLERRKGELWTYGQVILCVVLLLYLGYSLLK